MGNIMRYGLLWAATGIAAETGGFVWIMLGDIAGGLAS